MRFILYILLLLPLSSFSQLRDSSDDYYLDSLAKANVHACLHGRDGFSNILTLQPNDWVKFTATTGFNSRAITSIVNRGRLTDGLDYMSLGVYDIRMKVYVSKNIQLLERLVINGTLNSVYTNRIYTSGIIIKF
jgi:hypothetical protein